MPAGLCSTPVIGLHGTPFGHTSLIAHGDRAPFNAGTREPSGSSSVEVAASASSPLSVLAAASGVAAGATRVATT